MSFEFCPRKQSSEVRLPSNVDLRRRQSSYWNLNPTEIEWDPGLGWKLYSWLKKLERPYRLILDIPFEEPLRSEIRRFLIAVDAYLESSHVIDVDDLFRIVCFNKNAADILKKIKAKAVRLSFDAFPFEKPEWWDEIPSYRINDIGEIFNYSYSIFWKEDDEEDYKHYFIDVNVDEKYLNNFERILNKILDSLEEPELGEWTPIPNQGPFL
jgi:hypothetical protein